MAGEPVGAPVELGIGDHPLTVDDCGRLRRPRRLFREQIVEAPRASRVADLAEVVRIEELLDLSRGQQRIELVAAARIGGQRREGPGIGGE